MADETYEEESLISQEDIDRLLDASSIEEAEESLKQPPEPEEDDLGELSQDDIDNLMSGGDSDPEDQGISSEGGTEEDTGELSQDDIDRMMNSDASEPEPEPPPIEDGDEGGELSQDDIDRMMNGGASAPEADEPSAVEDEGAGELSQDDIDRMMNAGGPDGEAEADDDGADDVGELSQEDIDRMMTGGALESESEDNEDAEELELISQDDIQRLMNASPEEAADAGDEGDELELISQEDINDLMNDSADAGSGEEEPQTAGLDVTEDDFIIDESEAVDVAQTLITQETIDELIKNGPAPQPEENAGTEGPADDPGQPETVVLDDEPEDPEPSSIDAEEELAEVGRNDADESDLADQTLDEVTQEDIDSLLQGTDEDDGFLEDEEDILISQDDIDTLLMAADQEDEDVLGDLMDDSDSLEEFDAEDLLDSDEDNDQVVLEGAEEITREEEEEPVVSKSPWFKSKLVIAGFSVLLVLGITVPTAYFLFSSKESAKMPEKQPVPVAVYDPVKETEVPSVSIDVSQLSEIKKSGSIILTDFLILTSGNSSGMAYVLADISIDYTDQRAFHEINDNLPFYRDLIFESIQKNLVSGKENKVTKSDLIWEVENTLKKVLPPQYIERVSFKTFKTS